MTLDLTAYGLTDGQAVTLERWARPSETPWTCMLRVGAALAFPRPAMRRPAWERAFWTDMHGR